MGEKPKLITAAEARARLGITKVKMARLLKEGRFTIYTNPLDRRQKLIDEAELEEGVRPEPLAPRRRPAGGPEGKAAPENDRRGGALAAPTPPRSSGSVACPGRSAT